MNSFKLNQKIYLKKFIPEKVLCDGARKSYDLHIVDDGIELTLVYFTDLHNQLGKIGQKEHNILIPRFIGRNKKTFEVLGLLQAEMGKQQDGKIVFCNHEYQLINKVIKWFDKEFSITKDWWKWYIKVNINEPLDENYKKEIEEKVLNYWVSKTGLTLEQSHPKNVSYIKNTSNKKLGFYDYGTLIIERKSNLFSQIIKNFVKRTTQNILNYEENEIRSFLRGIIAGESCVEIDITSKKFRVHISATNPDEKLVYHNCLKKLGIGSIIYTDDKLVISKKQNNLELLKQKLMTLSHKKYNKFLRMMNLYNDFEDLDVWRYNLRTPHNKVPQSKLDKIIELHHEHPNWPAWKIAERIGVSTIKVNRVLKESNLGKRIVKTPEIKRKEIAQFAEEHKQLTQSQIAQYFNVHDSVVLRAIQKYKIQRGNAARCKIPEEKVKQVIEIYNKNPAVKFNEVMKEVGISDSALTRIRREYNLTHIGYKHIIGNNNPKMNSIIKIGPLIVEQ